MLLKDKKSVTKGIVALMLSVVLFTPQVMGNEVTGSAASGDDDSFTVDFSVEEYHKEKTYTNVMGEYAANGYSDAKAVEVTLMPDGAVSWDGAAPELKALGERTEPALIWNDEAEWYEWEFDVPEAGLYEIYVDYFPIEGSGSKIQRAVAVNGEVPFREAHNVSFYRVWNESGETRFNNIGDEVWPKQVENFIWQSTAVTDNQGFYDSPFKFYFDKGRNSIRLIYVDQPIAIGNIRIKSPEPLPTYAEVLSEYSENGYKDATHEVRFEAEVTKQRNDPTIRRESSNDPACSPSSAGNRILNIMGARRWRRGNQSITWEFQVPADGLYKLEMRTMQNYEDGLPSYRQIEIDGEIPFEELRCYRFEYDREWQRKVISDESGTPYLFYLTEGTHEITMTNKLGPVYDIVEKCMDDVMMLSQLTRKIIMITTNEPDPNFEYDLDRNIPGLVEDLQYLAARMKDSADTLTSISSKKPSMANNFMQISDQLEKMARNTDIIPRALRDLDNAQVNVGSYLINLQNMPLAFDFFVLSPKDMEVEMQVRSTFLQRFYVTMVNFFASFTKDYNSVGNVFVENEGASNTVINVWIARGREWGEILKEMADEDFTPKTGISVNLNILPTNQLTAGNVNTLMLSITSGRAPDVAMGVDSSSPTEFAFRDAVVDLKQFDTFDTVFERFYPSIFIPFEYNGGIFALPETMNFTTMFYRTDILQEIGMELPKTWDDVRRITLPKLYEHSMNFSFPQTASGSSNNVGNLGMLLFQHGGDFYRDNGTKSGLDSPQAYLAFKELAELYTNYGIPAELNFFTRMRSGDAPIGIAGYSHYMQMATSAPELYGRWAIAPVPGIVEEDGTINRSVGSMAGSTVMIMQQSQKKDEAWRFIDWWTSEEVQVRYGRELEALLGVEARWNTANKNAFNSLAWDSEHLNVIQYQLSESREQPVVLGGYFTARHIGNAWNRVVLKGETARDSLEQAVMDINKELRAKQEEYRFKP